MEPGVANMEGAGDMERAPCSPCKGCPCTSVVRWECTAKSGAVYTIGNLGLLAVWLEFPLVAYLVAYGGFILLAAGLLVKITKAVDIDNFTVEQVFSKEQALRLTSGLYGVFLSIANVALPVLFWRDVQTNLLVLFALYFFSGITSLISVTFLSLLVWNGTFLYGKFEKEILAIAGPHISQAQTLLAQYWAKIPRYQKKQA